MIASNQIETIDAYLRGELTPAQQTAFEELLDKDPNLAEELAFQKRVITGIKEARKLQLKNRLAQIDVTSGTVAGQSSWVKVIGGAMIATTMGVLTWQLLDEDVEAVVGEIDAPYYTIEETPAIDLPEKRIVKKTKQVPLLEVLVPEPVPSDDLVTLTPKQTDTDASAGQAEALKDMTFAPKVDLPDEDSEFDSSEFEPEELGETFSATEQLETSDIDALNVERFDERAKSLRYKYYDGKLALYGDFGDSPYQILEINQQDGGKQIYLLHADRFYLLEATKKEKSLVEIKDSALLSKLEIFQNKK